MAPGSRNVLRRHPPVGAAVLRGGNVVSALVAGAADQVTFTETGGAISAAVAGGDGAGVLLRTGNAVSLAVAGAADEATLARANGAISAAVVGGVATVIVVQETDGSAISALVAGAADQVTFTETGSFLSDAVAGAENETTFTETGGAVVGAYVEGSSVPELSRTGGVISTATAGGAKATTHARSCGPISDFYFDGTRISTRVRRGSCVSAFVAGGVKANASALAGRNGISTSANAVGTRSLVASSGLVGVRGTPGSPSSSAGHTLDFNGTSAYATIPLNSTTRPETNNAFSWAGWINLDSYSNNVLPRIWEAAPHYLSIMGDSTNGKYRKLGLEVVDTLNSAHEFWGGTSLVLGRDYHIVVTFNGNLAAAQVRMWVNGVEETVSPIFAWPNPGTMKVSNGSFWLVRRNAALTRLLDGRMSGPIVFYQAVLTPAEVATLYAGGLPAGYGFAFDVNEGTGTALNDLSANGNDAVLTATTWVSDDRGSPEPSGAVGTRGDLVGAGSGSAR